MRIFRRSQPKSSPAADASSPTPAPARAEGEKPAKPRSRKGNGEYSIVAQGTVVRGDVATEGTLRVDGAIAGSAVRADVVVIGEGGTVAGDVHAREVVVGGKVEGAIRATGRVELQPTAVVAGGIETPAIAIHEGATLHGQVTVRDVVARPAEEHGERAEKSTALPLTPRLAKAGADGR